MVGDPEEIGCEFCGAAPGEQCRTVKATGNIPRRKPHAIRWADSRLPEVDEGWVPTTDRDLAVVLDFGAALLRRKAAQNGVVLP